MGNVCCLGVVCYSVSLFCLVCLVDCLIAVLWVLVNCTFRFVLWFVVGLVLLYLIALLFGWVVGCVVDSLVSWLVVGCDALFGLCYCFGVWIRLC